MSYTTISNVAAMFPTWVRGGAQQKPSDTIVQQYLDDVSGEIDAVLNRRFATAISGLSGFAPWLTSLPVASAPWQANTAYALAALIVDSNGNPEQVTTAGTSGGTAPIWTIVMGGSTSDATVVWKNVSSDASRILEKVNRYGAAAQLGETLATFGVAAARDLGKSFAGEYLDMLNQLDARDGRGTPLPSGRYDKLFDSVARTETPRPAFQAVAGGDQDPKQLPSDVGLSNVFGKFDKRGT